MASRHLMVVITNSSSPKRMIAQAKKAKVRGKRGYGMSKR
jgi:hypothetical protein